MHEAMIEDLTRAFVREVSQAVADGRRLPIGALVEAMAMRHGVDVGALAAAVRAALAEKARRDCAHADELERLAAEWDADDDEAAIDLLGDPDPERTEAMAGAVVDAIPEPMRAVELMPAEIARDVPPLADAYRDDGTPLIAWVKFFSPWDGWRWYVTHYDPETRIAFGRVAGHELEYGSFDVGELEAIRGPLGCRIERDRYFVPTPAEECR